MFSYTHWPCPVYIGVFSVTSSSGDKCALFESGMYLLREIKYYSICITREGTKLYVLVKSCLKREKCHSNENKPVYKTQIIQIKGRSRVFSLFAWIVIIITDFWSFCYIFGHRLMTDLNINSRLIFCLNNLTSIISK